MTDTSRKVTLGRVWCIWYPVQFRRKNDKDKYKNLRALIDLDREFNAMHPAYATNLGLYARKIDVGI